MFFIFELLFLAVRLMIYVTVILVGAAIWLTVTLARSISYAIQKRA